MSWIFDWGLVGVWWGLFAFILIRLAFVCQRFAGDQWMN